MIDEDHLRLQVRARLAAGRLPLVNGMSRSQRGTGRPCLVCRLSIDPAEVEREVEGTGIFLHAHEACYKIWREESQAHRPARPAAS
jgi:hypothetical protein